MSQYFEVAGTVLWNPSNGVAQLFIRSLEAVAPTVELPTGLGPGNSSDDHEIDIVAFTTLVDALVRRYRSSTHLILRTLIEGVAAVGIVMVERAGQSVVSLTERATAVDPKDVAVFTSGFGAVGDAARLGPRRRPRTSDATLINHWLHADHGSAGQLLGIALWIGVIMGPFLGRPGRQRAVWRRPTPTNIDGR